MMAELSLVAKATLILAIALFATRAAPRARASVRSLILAAAFCLVLVLPIAAAIAPAREVRIPEVYATRFLIAEDIVDQRTDFVAAARHSAAAPTPAPWRLPSPQALTGAAWLLGTAVALFPLVLGLWGLRDIRRRAHDWPHGRELVDTMRGSAGLRRSVAVVLHEDVAAPMTCGWLRPAIALPADATNWPASDVRQALLHEFEHVRRHDWPVHILARVTCALYWFHPAAWIAWRQLSLESERACDDAVVSQAEHTAYAEQLVSLARRLSKRRAVPLLSMADHRTLSTRITSILSTTTARGRVGTLAAALVVMGAAALTAAIAPVKAIGAQARDALTILTSTEGPPFEVVSVKPNEPDDRRRVNDWQPAAGRLNLRNLTPRAILTIAYASSATLFLPEERLSGVPEWADEERFTIEGVVGRSVTAAEMQRMLRRILVDRFALRVHVEQREQASYRLVTVRPDRRLGPDLRPADADKCKASRPPRGGSEAWGPHELICTTIDLLALDLSERLGRPVLNQTGLTGLYDATLSYAPSAEELAVIYQLSPSELPPAVQTGPSLTTALREQLGLKLESTRAAIDVLVVDGIDRPTPNDAPGTQASTSPGTGFQFEAASVRRRTEPGGGFMGVRPGGRFTAEGVSLQDLIVFSYLVQPYQIAEGPGWLDVDRWDVNATGATGNRNDVLVALQRLLTERFSLTIRRDVRELPIYALVRARADGQVGPQLTPSSVDCAALRAEAQKTGVIPPDAPRLCAAEGRLGSVRIAGAPLTDLVPMLSTRVQRTVVDRTGLKGSWDLTLTYAPDPAQIPPGPLFPGVSFDPNGPSLFTALQEQLGLKLEATRAPVEVLVIERVDRPTAN